MNKSVTDPKPMVLLILDGFGIRAEATYNAIQAADTPILDKIWTDAPHRLLQASGEAVGLPPGQMGNSEVGHLHIGAGRSIPQDLTRINQAIQNGDFFKNPVLLDALHTVKKHHRSVHILGLLSAGGVHSQDMHIAAMIHMLQEHDIHNHHLHAILDGRDTPPKSALSSMQKIQQQYARGGSGKMASLIGRYYAMDRNNRWDRIKKAYDLLTAGTADFSAPDAEAGLNLAYQHHYTDEFVPPISLHAPDASPSVIQDGDLVIFMNFRADRARQLSRALTIPAFQHFDRTVMPPLSQYVTLTQYAEDIDAAVAFPPLKIKNTLGEYLSHRGYRQLRLAETEKYAHVTYFLNGGEEHPFDGEDRILIPSPKVATYNLAPGMSAYEITDTLNTHIRKKHYDFIVCNLANPDMVGHTGDETATIVAITILDTCLGKIIEAAKQANAEILITADHGNAEQMYDEQTQQPHTAHTCNPVPLIYIGRPAEFHSTTGVLQDIAPTLLYLMGLPVPADMTGQNLMTLRTEPS